MRTKFDPLDINKSDDYDFVTAEKFELFDENGKKLKFHKGVRDVDNHDKVFAVVSNSYKIAQHKEVADSIYGFVSELGMKHEISVTTDNDGGVLFLNIRFPDIAFNVGGHKANLYMPIKNSYDCTQALKGWVIARTIINDKVYLYKSSESWGDFYNKHVQSLDIVSFQRKMEKGINNFQTNLKKKLESYNNTPIDPQKALLFLQECQKDNPNNIPKKVFAEMEKILHNGGDTVTSVNDLNNQYKLYTLGMEAVEKTRKSDNSAYENSIKMDKFVKSKIDQFKGFGV